MILELYHWCCVTCIIDIDGGTDISADLTTSDLIIVDDGAGGTNRKVVLSRMVTLISANLDDPTALAIAWDKYYKYIKRIRKWQIPLK